MSKQKSLVGEGRCSVVKYNFQIFILFQMKSSNLEVYAFWPVAAKNKNGEGNLVKGKKTGKFRRLITIITGGVDFISSSQFIYLFVFLEAPKISYVNNNIFLAQAALLCTSTVPTNYYQRLLFSFFSCECV